MLLNKKNSFFSRISLLPYQYIYKKVLFCFPYSKTCFSHF